MSFVFWTHFSFILVIDSNEIDLDDLDKSDISSDWDSSVDEAPPMEVEETSEPTLIPNGKEQIEEEIRRMESDDEPDAIPRFFFLFTINC